MAGGKKFVRTEPGERIDHRDFEHVAELSPRNAAAQPVDRVIQGDDSTSPGYILSGFAVSTPTAATTDYVELTGSAPVAAEIRVNRGVALLGFRDRGEVQFGCVISGGADTKTIDVSSFSSGTYGVFVRFEFRDDEFQNRLFWNASAPTPVEFPRSISTRRSEDWSMAVELTSPGPEWVRIADVVKSGASLTSLIDKREFFFEGTGAYGVPDTEWGSAGDRDPDRAVNGIRGFRRFVRAIQKQVTEIIGKDEAGATAKWWSRSNAGTTAGLGSRSLAQLNEDKLDRGGAQTITGSILPSAETWNLGSNVARFLSVFTKAIRAEQAFLGTNLVDTSANALLPRITANFKDTGTSRRTRLFASFGAGAVLQALNIYRARATFGTTVGTTTANDTADVVFNAIWKDDPDNVWTQLDAAQDSYKFEFWNGGLRAFRKSAGAADWPVNGWDLITLTLDSNGVLTTSQVVAGSVLASSSITVTSGTLNVNSGSMTVNGIGTVDSLSLAFNGGLSFPALNRLYRDNLVASHGSIETVPGAGGSTVNIDYGFNIGSATRGQFSVTVTFGTPLPNANYSVTITDATNSLAAPVVPQVYTKSATSFTFRLFLLPTSTDDIDLDDLDVSNRRLHFQIVRAA